MAGPCRSICAEYSETLGMFSCLISSSHFRASLPVLPSATRNPPPPAPANVTPRNTTEESIREGERSMCSSSYHKCMEWAGQLNVGMFLVPSQEQRAVSVASRETCTGPISINYLKNSDSMRVHRLCQMRRKRSTFLDGVSCSQRIFFQLVE